MTDFMDSKNPGVKSELVINSFLTVFPECRSEYKWKNSQGIFSPSNKCIAKRSLCYSLHPVSFDRTLCEKFKVDLDTTPMIWGLCGLESTRANKALDKVFFLCQKRDEHFITVALATFTPNSECETGFNLSFIDSTEQSVTNFLDQMMKEKDEYRKQKALLKRARQNNVKVRKPREKVRRLTPPEVVPCLQGQQLQQEVQSVVPDDTDQTESIISESVISSCFEGNGQFVGGRPLSCPEMIPTQPFSLSFEPETLPCDFSGEHPIVLDSRDDENPYSPFLSAEEVKSPCVQLIGTEDDCDILTLKGDEFNEFFPSKFDSDFTEIVH